MRLSKETSLFKHDAIAEDLQAVLDNVSNNYTTKSAGVSRSHRIYYRSNSSTKPNPPTTAILGNQAFWVTESGNQYATTGGSSTVMTKWSTKITPMAEDTMVGRTKYIYLWTCEQYQMADGKYYATAVLVDDSNVVIDGGSLVAGSITANEIDATDLHVSVANIDGSLTIGDITNLQDTLDTKTTSSDVATAISSTNVSGLADGSSYTKTNDLGSTTAVQNAAKTADTYISRIDDNGITIHAKSNPTNNYSKIDANGLTVFKGGNNVATFGDTARVGKASSSHFMLNADSLQAYDSSNNLYFQVSANGMTYGTNKTVATQDYVTDQGYQTSNQVNDIVEGKGYQTSNQVSSAISVFVETTSSGIKVRNSAYPNNYALIDSNGLSVYRNVSNAATLVASFGASSQIGAISGKNILINSDGFIFKNGSSELGRIVSYNDAWSMQGVQTDYSGTNDHVYKPAINMDPDGIWAITSSLISSNHSRSQLYLSFENTSDNGPDSSTSLTAIRNDHISMISLYFEDSSHLKSAIGLHATSLKFKHENTGTNLFNVSSTGVAGFGSVANTFSMTSHTISLPAANNGDNTNDTNSPLEITKSGGYYPVAIAGFDTNKGNAVPTRLYLSVSSNKYYLMYNVHAVGNYAASTMTVYVLWIKTA